jgi:predicted Abi (CAAX) family protease
MALSALYDTAWRRVAAAAATTPTSTDWLQVIAILIVTCAVSLPVGLNTSKDSTYKTLSIKTLHEHAVLDSILILVQYSNLKLRQQHMR